MLKPSLIKQLAFRHSFYVNGWKIAGNVMLLSAIFACPSLSFAQSQDQSEQDQKVAIEEVIVTGSRLLRSNNISPSPVVTLGEEDISVSSTGNVTLISTLNEWPQLVPDNTPSLNSPGGSGVWAANLRGLGAERSLVLVDGRRYIPGSATGLVDLATIPQALIKSVEIITGGASAVYGSDAIAGAINFKLRDDLEGVEAEYSYLEAGEGDGQTQNATVSFGSRFADDRGYVLLSATHTEQDPVFFADRAFSAIPLIDGDGVNLVPSGSGNIPGVGLRLSGPQLSQLVGVDLTNTGTPFGVGPTGSCTGIAGVRFGDGGEVLPFCRPENNYNFAATNFLLRPLERTQISGIANLEIGEKTRAFGQFFYTHKDNSYQQAPESLTLQSSGAPPGVLLVPDAANNPLFPQNVRDFFANNGAIFDPDGDGTATITNAGRRFSELGSRFYSFVTDSYNITLGLDGEINLLSSDWQWSVFGQTQRAEENALSSNLVSSLKLSLGLDVVTNSDGSIVCRNALIGCVPVSPFGIDSLTPEMATFLSTPAAVKQVFERNIVGGGLAGTLFNLPAGEVPFAFGFEARKDKFKVLPDEVNLTNQVRGAITEQFSGTIDVFELYAETRIPILNDIKMIDELAVELAGRYSDYSTIGGVYTWKAGVDWRMTDDIRLRGSFNSAIRAPSLNELFSPRINTTTGLTDPCDSRLNPAQSVKDFCVLLGVPADVIDSFVPTNPAYTQVVGGNPDLFEETSETWSYGVVVTPAAVPGLEISVDYYDITVDDAISVASSQVVANTCFALGDPNSSFCQSLPRFSTGPIREVQSTNQNFASLNVSGIDVQAFYGLDLPTGFALPGQSDASLDFRLVANWVLENSEQPLPNQPKIQCEGLFAGPCSSQDKQPIADHTGSFTTSYSSGPGSLRAQVRWINGFSLFPGTRRAVDKIDRIFYADLSGHYQIGDSVQVFAGVNNVFDEQPPIVGFFAGGDPNVSPSTFDVIGRRFFAGLKLIF